MQYGNNAVDILRATAAHRDALIALIAELNTTPAHQCLHCDTERDGIALEVGRLLAGESVPFIVAVAEGRPVGAIGCDIDDTGATCWLRGPFVAVGAPADTAQRMYEALAPALPATLRDMLAFPNADNTLSRSFYTALGFTDTNSIRIYTAPRPERLPDAEPGVRLYDDSLFAAMDTLHTLAFPGAVETARDIVGAVGEDKRLFVVVDDSGALEGYIAVSLNDTPVEGYVDFLAVHPDSRGRGVGERLLRRAMHWFFAERDMPQAGLCVRDDRANARRLYERAGFSLFASGVGMRKRLAAQPTAAA